MENKKILEYFFDGDVPQAVVHLNEKEQRRYDKLTEEQREARFQYAMEHLGHDVNEEEYLAKIRRPCRYKQCNSSYEEIVIKLLKKNLSLFLDIVDDEITIPFLTEEVIPALRDVSIRKLSWYEKKVIEEILDTLDKDFNIRDNYLDVMFRS